ncbi:MAG: tetratricopeptide repeat protein, partial [Candidatus Acidoferrales bacterium]|nr:tetratricopeptide repeat protein [Candidatus Acidoferrales bacterium]
METPLTCRHDCTAVKRCLITTLASLLAVSPLAVRATGDFYELPLQTLPDYLKLDQLPAKSIDDIVAESAKPAPEAPEINFAAELLELSKKPGRDALASVDKMIVAARAKAASPLLNLLNDIRDVLAGPATAAETASYLQWRIEKADQFGVTLDKGKAAESPSSPPQPDAALGKEIDAAIDKASPALKPHWLYLSGAVEFLSRDIDGAQSTFLDLAKEYPKSPRAEVALFMAARCAVYKARNSEYNQQDMKLNAADRPAAKKLWDEYFAKYPHGRFLGDALGWYGAYAFDGRDFGTALRCYLQQLEMTDHPELAPMAAEMVMKTLSHIASDPKDKYFAEVAKYPKGAQALVYLVINTSESDNYNGKLDSIDEVRGWRKKVLPRIAAAISAQGKLYQNAEWKPRYLAMLAYAASGVGQHEQAIKLLESAGAATEQSDDLLMARGVVFHRARRPAEAAKALQTLLEKFPDSPLVKGARLRLGLALADDHRGGEAVLALHKLLPEKKDATEKKPDAPDAANANNQPAADEEETPEEPDGDQILYGLDLAQIRALIDTLLNFAPESELAAAAQTSGLDPVLRLMFTEAVAERYLAREQFDEAKKYMTPAQYGLLAASLEKLTIAAREAKEPAARLAACLKLGDAWAAARGKLLTYPLDTHERRREVYIDYFAEANVRRADSAPFIGASGNYKLDLENRDELRHAFNWWIEASNADHGAPQTAPALWRALKAMPQIADVSPFTYERAATRKW